jgi:hypothetical protein
MRRSRRGFLDARGHPLRAGAEQRYQVGGEERRHVDPGDWTLTVPPARISEPVQVTFGRPLDHGLLARCLRLTGPGGQPVSGTARTGPQERSWQLELKLFGTGVASRSGSAGSPSRSGEGPERQAVKWSRQKIAAASMYQSTQS